MARTKKYRANQKCNFLSLRRSRSRPRCVESLFFQQRRQKLFELPIFTRPSFFLLAEDPEVSEVFNSAMIFTSLLIFKSGELVSIAVTLQQDFDTQALPATALFPYSSPFPQLARQATSTSTQSTLIIVIFTVENLYVLIGFLISDQHSYNSILT